MTRTTHSGCHPAPAAPPPASTSRRRERDGAAGDGYRGPVAARAAGITYRQLDYWARSGLVEPSVRARPESAARLYHAGDVLVLTVVRRLLEAGVCLQQIRTTTTALREHALPPHEGHAGDGEHGDLATLTLMCDGATVYPCTSADEVIELVQGGQGVFGIAVGPVWNAVRAVLATLPVEDGPVRPSPPLAPDELAERRAARATG